MMNFKKIRVGTIKIKNLILYEMFKQIIKITTHC